MYAKLTVIVFMLLLSAAIYGTPESTPVFIHNVYFWLKDNVTEQQRADFEADLRSLRKIKYVKHIWVGSAAGTPRDVVDNSYDLALIVHFRNREAHDAYQVDPTHLETVGRFLDLIDRFVVYDTVGD